MGKNERVKAIELQRALIWSKHTSYNSDFTKLLLGKGHGPKHTLMSESVKGNKNPEKLLTVSPSYTIQSLGSLNL